MPHSFPPRRYSGLKEARQSLAVSIPISRAPIAMAFASLCLRARRADRLSDTSAQRTPGLRLAAIEIPMPDPHNATRSEEPNSELQSQMRHSYTLFCWTKTKVLPTTKEARHA